ncbi:hypothetical protein C8F04DRAFT_499045 [Mycena alexandri]|uniref:Uncharacterized protein n=1 Tax=Mycena alexandri TaxID=1745969 RepID=A0AAD6X572_9AGAR|nr:hypothetical protein C8F04DRAFT_499045 [Mycena alexandri]
MANRRDDLRLTETSLIVPEIYPTVLLSSPHRARHNHGFSPRRGRNPPPVPDTPTLSHPPSNTVSSPVVTSTGLSSPPFLSPSSSSLSQSPSRSSSARSSSATTTSHSSSRPSSSHSSSATSSSSSPPSSTLSASSSVQSPPTSPIPSSPVSSPPSSPSPSSSFSSSPLPPPLTASSPPNHHLLPILLGTLLPLFFGLVLLAGFVLYRRRRAWEDTLRARTLSPDEDYYWVPAPSSGSGAGSWRRRSTAMGNAAGIGTSAHTASASWQRLGSVPPSPTGARRAHAPSGAGTSTGMTWNGSDVLVLGPEPSAGADEKATAYGDTHPDEEAPGYAWNRSPSPPGLEGVANVNVEREEKENPRNPRNELTPSAKSDVDVDLTPSDEGDADGTGADADASTEATYGTAYTEFGDKSDAGHGLRHDTGTPRPHPYAYAESSEGHSINSFDTASTYSTHDGDYYALTRPSAPLAQALLRLSRSPTFVTFESAGYSEADLGRTPPTPPPHYSRPLPRIPVPVPPLPRPPSFSSS